jgi:hypothetical protein
MQILTVQTSTYGRAKKMEHFIVTLVHCHKVILFSHIWWPGEVKKASLASSVPYCTVSVTSICMLIFLKKATLNCLPCERWETGGLAYHSHKTWWFPNLNHLVRSVKVCGVWSLLSQHIRPVLVSSSMTKIKVRLFWEFVSQAWKNRTA